MLEEYKPELNYMDKMAVAEEFQKNGIGRILWNEMRKDADKIIWRGIEHNMIASKFYHRICDGIYKQGDWIVYWKGLEKDEVDEGIEYALNKEYSFVKPLLSL